MLLAQKQRSLLKKPIHWNPQQPLPKPEERLAVTGHFLDDLFLLDNQHHQHQLGYHVISPFIVNGSILLVDRGWVPMTQNQQPDPPIQTPTKTLTLNGSAYYPSPKQWVLGPKFSKLAPHITVIELFDAKLMHHFLHKSINPFIMRLDESAPYGYHRDWVVINMPPERHLGYALQWFTMAFVILILFISLNTQKTLK
ncbi:MAG: hypothetical protein B7X00_01835 [Legionella sp. 21-45-4]|nr:MAG: hypothetical protein B7X00_01835 [Legionella sp. 21-45-4]